MRKLVYILVPIEIILYFILGLFLSLVSLCGIAAIGIEYYTIKSAKKDGESVFSPDVFAVTLGVFVTVAISITVLLSELVIFK